MSTIQENIERGWAEIEGFPGYRVTIDGDVLSCILKHDRWVGGIKLGKEWKRKKPELSKKGYFRIRLHCEEYSKNFQLHRLVANAFISNPESKPQVNHINAIRNDNSLKNLEWVTNSENQLHSFRVIGRETMKGMRNGHAKFTDDDIRTIRQRIKNGERQWVIAKDYSVHQVTISKINIGIRWKHV